jgi:toxin ParE1/3/4
MQYNYTLSKQALQTIDEATLWYEAQKYGLGEEFLSGIDHALLSIQSNPLLYGFRKKNIRAYNLQRFPYKIYFIVRKGHIFVMSVLHTSRQPKI